MEVKKHLELLGMRCEDRVTGLTGVVVSISFDLYGCIQAILHPGINEKGLFKESVWLDIARLKVISDTRVMNLPDFISGEIAEGKKGPAEKPIMGRYNGAR